MLKRTYAGTVGIEYMFIQDREKCTAAAVWRAVRAVR